MIHRKHLSNILAAALMLTAGTAAGAITQEELLSRLDAQQKQIESLQKELAEMKAQKESAPPAPSAEPSYDERIKELVQESIEEYHGHVSSHTYLEDMKRFIEIHGFISQGFLQTTGNNYLVEDSKDGSFQFNEMGLNFSSKVADKLRLGMQLFSRDLGSLDNNKIALDWAYADYRWQDWLGLRLGKMKSPFGMYNETRDIDMLRNPIFLPQSIYSEGMRDSFSSVTGVGFYGTIPLDFFGELSYQAQYGYIDIDNDSGVAQYFDSTGLNNAHDIECPRMTVAELEWQTPLEGLRFSATGRWTNLEYDGITTNNFAYGPGLPLNIDLDNMQIYTVSGEYVRGPWTFNSEIVAYRSEMPVRLDRIPVDTDNDGEPDTTTSALLSDSMYDMMGYYWGGAYRFTKWFELGSYYSIYVDEMNNRVKDLALTGRFDITDHWIFKLEGHYFQGGEIAYFTMNPNGLEDYWFLFAAKMTFSF